METSLIQGIPWSHRMSWEVFPLLFFVFWVFKNIYFKTLFTFSRTVFGAVCGLSLAVKSRNPLQFWCPGFSRCRASALALSPGVVAHGLSCPTACGTFPGQELNPCPCTGRWVPNHWATREALCICLSMPGMQELSVAA